VAHVEEAAIVGTTTITKRFKRLAARAGPPEIDLHDVRHSYATAGRDAKIDWKAHSASASVTRMWHLR
jgi:integrase